jgi:hypothetical protein
MFVCLGMARFFLFAVAAATGRMSLMRSCVLRGFCLFFLRLRFMFRVLRGFCCPFLRFGFVFLACGIANAGKRKVAN